MKHIVLAFLAFVSACQSVPRESGGIFWEYSFKGGAEYVGCLTNNSDSTWIIQGRSPNIPTVRIEVLDGEQWEVLPWVFDESAASLRQVNHLDVCFIGDYVPLPPGDFCKINPGEKWCFTFRAGPKEFRAFVIASSVEGMSLGNHYASVYGGKSNQPLQTDRRCASAAERQTR